MMKGSIVLSQQHYLWPYGLTSLFAHLGVGCLLLYLTSASSIKIDSGIPISIVFQESVVRDDKGMPLPSPTCGEPLRGRGRREAAGEGGSLQVSKVKRENNEVSSTHYLLPGAVANGNSLSPDALHRPLPRRGEVKDAALISPQPSGTNSPPIYPEEARRRHIEGIVEVRLTLTQKGEVADILVLNESHPLLKKATLDALKKWKFQSSGRAPKAEEKIEIDLPIAFRLN